MNKINLMITFRYWNYHQTHEIQYFSRLIKHHSYKFSNLSMTPWNFTIKISTIASCWYFMLQIWSVAEGGKSSGIFIFLCRISNHMTHHTNMEQMKSQISHLEIKRAKLNFWVELRRPQNSFQFFSFQWYFLFTSKDIKR